MTADTPLDLDAPPSSPMRRVLAYDSLVAEVRRLREALTGALYELRHVADTSQCEAILATALGGQ